ncbi:hypothetical protein L249_6398 [Ophiocordyceps polyrhachis-furcata BCC 54312]|uniref:Uncharacterized protein n=1 Tax=Ophiocordyceps polyrhachis-furcata BCC 54312 TaxID=1330021 RepID=A0A367LK50_9HYPO|nr:hypothetical protein L249_6398 [Ophiocordyceps polyrhachis-furcata BCC 54312]
MPCAIGLGWQNRWLYRKGGKSAQETLEQLPTALVLMISRSFVSNTLYVRLFKLNEPVKGRMKCSTLVLGFLVGVHAIPIKEHSGSDTTLLHEFAVPIGSQEIDISTEAAVDRMQTSPTDCSPEDSVLSGCFGEFLNHAKKDLALLLVKGVKIAAKKFKVGGEDLWHHAFFMSCLRRIHVYTRIPTQVVMHVHLTRPSKLPHLPSRPQVL